jgi:DNA-directed RNA polymerase subunit beta
MNVGQILETHLGWACAGLGRQIGEMLDRCGARASGQLRKHAREDLRRGALEGNGSSPTSELSKLAENLKGGVPIATPVFDGAREDDIVTHARKAGLSTRPGDADRRPHRRAVRFAR